MQRGIVGFEMDETGDWVALLACGHCQHVRHTPPWQERPWVLVERGREARIGTPLECRLCDQEAEEGGDPACWAHTVCPTCGSIDGHAGARRDRWRRDPPSTRSQ